jgi:hypothetical protein
VDVARGSWGRVTPATFADAVDQVLGGLSEAEHSYVYSLALEQVTGEGPYFTLTFL